MMAHSHDRQVGADCWQDASIPPYLGCLSLILPTWQLASAEQATQEKESQVEIVYFRDLTLKVT